MCKLFDKVSEMQQFPVPMYSDMCCPQCLVKGLAIIAHAHLHARYSWDQSMTMYAAASLNIFAKLT